MRPKKVILLCCDTILRTEELRFVLKMRRFDVITPNECSGWNKRSPDVAMVVQTLSSPEDWAYTKATLDALRRQDRLPILMLKETVMDATPSIAVEAFYAKGTSMAEIVDRLRILAARRRGPKKQVQEAVAA